MQLSVKANLIPIKRDKLRKGHTQLDQNEIPRFFFFAFPATRQLNEISLRPGVDEARKLVVVGSEEIIPNYRLFSNKALA